MFALWQEARADVKASHAGHWAQVGVVRKSPRRRRRASGRRERWVIFVRAGRTMGAADRDGP